MGQELLLWKERPIPAADPKQLVRRCEKRQNAIACRFEDPAWVLVQSIHLQVLWLTLLGAHFLVLNQIFVFCLGKPSCVSPQLPHGRQFRLNFSITGEPKKGLKGQLRIPQARTKSVIDLLRFPNKPPGIVPQQNSEGSVAGNTTPSHI